jgi:hypothetical protein
MAYIDNLTKDFDLSNAPKRLLKKISTTTTATVTALGTSYVDGGTLADLNCTLVLQSDQDFYYELTSTTTAVTDYSGSRPGVKVLAGQQEWVRNLNGKTSIDVKSVASGTLAIFVASNVAGG